MNWSTGVGSVILITILLTGVCAPAGAQVMGMPWDGSAGSTSITPAYEPQFTISQEFEGWFPRALEPDSRVSYVMGTATRFSFSLFPIVELLARIGVYSMQLVTNESLAYIGGAAGVGYSRRVSDGVTLNTSGFAGVGKIPDVKIPSLEQQSYGLYELGARVAADFRLSAAMTVGVSAGYARLATPTLTFLDALTAGVRINLSPAELRRSRSHLTFKRIATEEIFPVLRSWYDTEPLGTVTVRNDEAGPIENVRVYFHAPEYMGGPRLSGVVARIPQGESAVIPLHAVFDERVLALTQNVTTSASVNVEYSYFGSRRTATESTNVLFYHRNAMTWADDRRAAAFVSPTDPAALWFARYASSIVRDRMRGDLPANLQYALGIFEALRLYGVNYVIDPNSAYIEMSENAMAVDYLQYPGETLMYRGGDCDDLSILYSSLLESMGISTAFITLPGHIYMAFDIGINEAEAREQFFDPGLLIFRDGRAWAPIEITMVREGFVKAWRVGAKQWIDNNNLGTAEFFVMRQNWVVYPPSGLQNAPARFDLPDEADAMAAFDTSVDRFIVRELGPTISDYEARLASARDPETLNEFGVVLARAGMLDAGWDRFREAASAGYVWAWNNLANIAFARKDYRLAYSYYEWAESLLTGDPVALLGLARSAYEMDRYADAEILYARISTDAPILSSRFAYLASVYGGPGRAWSLADRLTGTVWSRPGLSFVPEEPAGLAVPVEVPFPPEPVAAAQPVPVTIDTLVEPGPDPVRLPAAAIEPEVGAVEEIPAPAGEPPPAPPPPAPPPPPPVVTVVPSFTAPMPPEIVQRAPLDADIVARTTLSEPGPALTPEPEPEPLQSIVPPWPSIAVVVLGPESSPAGELPADRDRVVPGVVDYVNFLDDAVRTGSGRWELEQFVALMTDPGAMYAKLILPARPFVGPTAYQFTARSTGSGFAGFGIHIHGRGAWTLSHFGGGDSILVWITSDPRTHGDADPRLEIYRSYGEVSMTKRASVRISGSAFASRFYRIQYDPDVGTLLVFVDGVHYLAIDGLTNPTDFNFAALRSLGTAVFTDLQILQLDPGSPPEEAYYE